MNKIYYFSLLLLVVVFSACKTDKTYTLTATITDPAYEGKTVYLLHDDDKGKTTRVDSTTVDKGSFTFSGIAPDSITYAFIEYENRDRPTMFIIERGNVNMSIGDGKARIKGTPLNDSYQNYKDSFSLLMIESRAYSEEELEKKYNGPLSPEIREKVEKEKAELLEGFENHVFRFVEANKDNALGGYVFSSDAYFMNPDKALELLSSLSAPFSAKARARDSQGLSHLDAQKTTSVGSMYTDIHGYGLKGEKMALSDYVQKGNFVLLEFWASWCRPCRAVLPQLKGFYEANKNKGLTLVSVSLDEEKEAWMKASKEENIYWPQFSDLGGYDGATAKTYGIRGIPHCILIDQNGIIVSRGSWNGAKVKFELLTQK